MADNLMLFQHPVLPDEWDYAASVKKMAQMIYKWKNMTRKVANELWVARENLSSAGRRNDLTSEQKFRGWGKYCEDIGIAQQTANRWLNKWFPECLDLKVKPVITESNYKDWLAEQDMYDLLLTDPPYSTDLDDVYSFAKEWMPLAFKNLKPTGRAYICIGAYPEEINAYLSVINDIPFRLSNILVWTYKNTLGPSPTHEYKLNWQAVLYFIGPDAPPLNCKQMVDQFTVIDIVAPDGRQGDRYHSWQKPLELGRKFVVQGSKDGDIVADPFAGTGTFLLAANNADRIGIGCDVDEVSISIAVKRGCLSE